MGPVFVTVKSDVLESQFKKGQYYVVLDIDGVERTYNIENDNCMTAFDGQKGASFTIEAQGSRDEATVEYIGDEPPAQEQQQQRPPPRGNAPPQSRPAQRPAPQTNAHRPANPPQRDNGGEVATWSRAKVTVARRLSLMKVTLNAALSLAEDWKAWTGNAMESDLFQSLHAQLFIASERAMVKETVKYAFYADAMPANVSLEKLEVVHKEKQADAPPAKPKQARPAPAAEPEPAAAAPVEEDDVPF